LESFKPFEESLYGVNDHSFEEIALKLFEFQAKNNPVYAEYIHYLGVRPALVNSLNDIPYLPVSFFKTHDIRTLQWKEQTVFISSGTTGTVSSRHAVYNLDFYLSNTVRCFSSFYGNPSDYTTLALLPSYAERQGSSLIAMIEHFIRLGGGGSYHNDHAGLLEQLRRQGKKKVILWGVTFALLDLAEEHELDLSNCVVFETGGMKGRRKEITRAELHEFLGKRFHTRIHSEYGMTELMSQAYSTGDGVFRCPSWMKVVLRDPEDPRDLSEGRERGGINIIDLANIHTCAFIETQDLGKMSQKGYFEVLGRMDNSDIRGCNLLVE
jgi:phenylacetate-coenzyme A ligase PaaK-like adenylate-forming protein